MCTYILMILHVNTGWPRDLRTQVH